MRPTPLSVVRMLARFGVMLGLSLGVLSATPPQSVLGVSAASWSFNWLGQDPAAPQPWNPATWDVVVHSRDIDTLTAPEPMAAQHGSDCSPPPATHPISSYEASVFVCKQHMMTAIKAGGYGVIYLTPDHMMDMSGGGTSSLKFSVSTVRTSNRDWFDLWITPWQENLVLPLQLYFPDLSGPPRDSIHLMLMSEDRFTAELYRNCLPNANCAAEALPVASTDSWDSRLTPSERTRTPFELDLSQQHIRFGIPSANLWWIDTDVAGGLPFDQGIVQVGHHSYNPTKSDGCGAPTGQPACEPNTWHWSDFSISRAAGFSMLRPVGDQVTAHEGSEVVTFPSPAPAGSFLRFVGLGKLTLSFNGGPPTTPQLQVQAGRQGTGITDPGDYANYWTPVPAGTTSIRFAGQDWWGGPWWAEGIAIWNGSPTAVVHPTPAPPAAAAPSPSLAPVASLPSPGPRVSARAAEAMAVRRPSGFGAMLAAVPMWPVTLPLALLLVLGGAGAAGYALYRRRFYRRVTAPPAPPAPPR